jgi:hypothetical protein
MLCGVQTIVSTELLIFISNLFQILIQFKCCVKIKPILDKHRVLKRFFSQSIALYAKVQLYHFLPNKFQIQWF